MQLCQETGDLASQWHAALTRGIKVSVYHVMPLFSAVTDSGSPSTFLTFFALLGLSGRPFLGLGLATEDENMTRLTL
jgi:hypothetical protein